MDMADCRVLGPVELWIENQPVDIGTPGQRHVLAVLMLSPGQVVTIEELIDRVWGEKPPNHVRNVLYSYVARLRKTWRSHRYPGDPLFRSGGGYLLDIAPEAVDCHRFRERVAQAREPGTHAEERRSLLLGALGEWRGTPLAGLGGEWAARVRYWLAQQRLNTLAELADLKFEAGAHGSAIDVLHDGVAEYPLSDALALRLVRALHRTGRGAEALAIYAAFRKRVVSELGAEPGPELRAVHREVLHATATVPVDEPRPISASSWRGPHPHLTRLIGRAEEQAQLTRLLASERLVTVTGVGGCGKTALALRVGRDAADRLGVPGAALSLVGSTSADQVASSLNGLVGGDDDGVAPLTAVERILAAGPWLLVLDNCEHIAAAVAGVVARLLGTCPKLTVLATSRRPLDVTGETVLTLRPLAVPPLDRPADLSSPAAEVFALRAHQAVASMVIGPDDVEDVARICRRLDGLPLALELIAARVRTFTLHELAERLGTDLTLLFRDGTGGDARHRTLEGALDWSFRLLSAAQQHLLARLSTFVGGFTVADAEVVCGFPPLGRAEVAALLAALVDQSLVQPYDLDGTRRYQLLELVRIFAAGRLTEFGEGEVCAHRHLDHRLALARRIDFLPRYAERASALRALEPDAANLRGCLEHAFTSGRPLDAAEIIARNFEFWLVNRGYLAEGRTLLDRALCLPGLPERPEVLALLRFHQALLVSMSGDRLRGLELVRGVIEDLHEHRPRECLEGRAALLTAKCMLLDPSVLDEVAPAVSMAQHSESVDDARVVLNAASWVLITWGLYDEATALHKAYDRLGPVYGGSAAAALSPRVLAALGRADLPTARAMAEALHSMLAQIAHAAEHNDPRLAIAQCYLCHGEVDRTVSFLRESWEFLSTSYPLLTRRFTDLQVLLAEAYRRAGDLPAAVRTLCTALETAAGSTDFVHSFTGVPTAALIAHDLGDHEASRMLASRWDSLRQRLGLPIPVRFERGAAPLLTLDPSPPARPAAKFDWDAVAVANCIAGALEWCRQPTSPVSRPPVAISSGRRPTLRSSG